DRQREGERLGLLPVHTVQLEPCARRVLQHFCARTPEAVGLTRRHGHEATEPDLGVPRGELRLAPNRRLMRLALARRLGLAEASAELLVRAVARNRRFDLPGRALRWDRFKGHRDRTNRARASEQRV